MSLATSSFMSIPHSPCCSPSAICSCVLEVGGLSSDRSMMIRLWSGWRGFRPLGNRLVMNICITLVRLLTISWSLFSCEAVCHSLMHFSIAAMGPKRDFPADFLKLSSFPEIENPK